MLAIDDFILIMPLNDNDTDYSLNAFSKTNEGVAKTTDKDGVSNRAYEWADVSDRFEFASSVGNTIATAINDECSFYFEADFRTLSSSDLFRTIHQWSSSAGQFGFTLTAANTGSLVQQFSMACSTDGSLATNTALSNTNSLDSNWNDWLITFEDNATTTDVIYYKNGVSAGSDNVQKAKTNSSLQFRIGARSGDNTQGNIGKMNNILIANRKLNLTERAFINKFGNMKRVA